MNPARDQPLRIVVMPGDTRFNLGDIAICLGLVRMLRQRFGAPAIAVWGHRPCVDRGFEGVRFVTGAAAWRAAIAADVLAWGGGQLLQGNRSVVKIPYWVARVLVLRALGKKIVGFAQGLGPFPRRLDRMLVRTAVACTRVFTVRDRDSLRLLHELGVAAHRTHLVADPALALAAPSPAAAVTDTSRPRLGLSLRYTRHHRQGRLVPFQFLPPALRRRVLDGADVRAYAETMAALCDRLVERLDADLVLVPMYYAAWETDLPLARALLSRMRHRDRVHLVEATNDIDQVVTAFDSLDAFVGTPMHSTILATSRGVPTLALHYEPKGREYLERLGMLEWTFALEDLWSARGFEALEARVVELWERRHETRRALCRRVPRLRRQALASARLLQAAVQERT